MKYAKVYYYNMYAPHRMLRRYVGGKVFRWADAKYGVEARGPVTNGTLTEHQTKLLHQWHKRMVIKNRIRNKI